MKLSLSLLFALLPFFAMAQVKDKPAYQLFDSKGKKVSYKKMMKKINAADVFFFGESHNNPIAHWLELEITRSIHTQKGDSLTLGAEMFESDNQILLDEYLSGMISEKNFEKEARLWNNYSTDYKPLINFAKAKQLRMIATNIPRRYASIVFKKGIETLQKLSPLAQAYIAPLPIEVDLTLPGYAAMMEMMMGQNGNTNFPKAQAIKDATMAHFIATNWSKGRYFVHYNGSYHSDNGEGILWYLNRYAPTAKTATLSTVEQADIDKLSEEHLGKADFILCIPESMTKTY